MSYNQKQLLLKAQRNEILMMILTIYAVIRRFVCKTSSICLYISFVTVVVGLCRTKYNNEKLKW
jgi:hypothetical protein